MRRGSLAVLAITSAFLLGLSTGAGAQQGAAPAPQKRDIGKAEFDGKCATCHGVTGKGDGPTAAYLTRKIPDLTVLAKNNNGVIPVAGMYEVITGEKEVPAHGTRDMPVWGAVYRIQAGEHYFGAPYDPEIYVRARILALIDYINRLQAK